MKGKNITSLVAKLLLICAVASLILAFVNSKTAPVISERQQKELEESYGKVYPDGEFRIMEDSELGDILNENIIQVVEVSIGGEQVGYVIKVLAKGGYGGDIDFVIGVQNDGLVKGFQVLNHSETNGFGAAIADEEYAQSVIDSMFNQPIIASGKGEGENEVELISGATFTTDAMTNGFNAVVDAMSKLSDEIGDIDFSEIENKEEEIDMPSKDDLLGLVDGADSVLLITDESIKNDIVKNAFEISSGDKKAIAIQVLPKGFGGNINYTVGILDDVVTGITITKSNETEGFGAAIKTDDYKGKIIDLNINDLPKADGISGATITTNAMKDGYSAIVEAYNALKDGGYETTEYTGGDSNSEDTSSFDPLTLLDGATKSEQTSYGYELSDDSGVCGYDIQVKAKGYGGDIIFIVGLDLDGNISGFEVIDHSETTGFGAKITDDEYKEKIIGKNISELGNEAAISGATLTTNGMKDGFDQVNEAFSSIKAGETPDTGVEINSTGGNDAESSATGEAKTNTDFDPLKLVEGAKEINETSVEGVSELTDGENILGYAIEVTGEGGYGGDIKFAVGVDKDGNVVGFEVIEHGETTGFGAKITDDKYKESIVGKKIDDLSSVDSISGATVTSKAMQNGFDKVIDAYNSVGQ